MKNGIIGKLKKLYDNLLEEEEEIFKTIVLFCYAIIDLKIPMSFMDIKLWIHII